MFSNHEIALRVTGSASRCLLKAPPPLPASCELRGVGGTASRAADCATDVQDLCFGWRRGPARGFDALDYRKIKHCDAGKLGDYSILSVLPDKFARLLYEFHEFRFENLGLPPLPADRSDFHEHGALEDAQVTHNVNIY